MNRNILKLNQDKTEIILFGSDFNIRKQPTATLRIGDNAILSQSYSQVCNLDGIFDSKLSMDRFVLRNLRVCDMLLLKVPKTKWKPKEFFSPY